MATKPGLESATHRNARTNTYGTLGVLNRLRWEEEQQRQRNARSAGEAMDLVRSYGDYGLERRAAEQPQPVEEERQPLGPNTFTPETEYRRQTAAGAPNKLTPYQVYMNAQVSAAAEPEPQTWKRPTGPEAPTQKLTPDVEAERLRRASGEAPSNGLTPYAQYRATYEAQRQNEAQKARENAESGWSYARDTLKGGAQEFESMMQNPLSTLDKLDYWIMNKLGGTFGGMKANTKQAYDAAHAIDTDIQRSVSAAKAGKGKWARSIIDAFGAAGNIFGSSMMGYGLTGMGTADKALAPVADRLSAASAGPGAGLGERVVAGASRLAGNMLGDIAANPTNLFISAQSGIGTFDTAKSYGADDRTAATAGMAAAMTEYFSNKMFSGTPLEDNPNEKGYVVELLEDITDGLAKTGNAGARFQKYAGKFFSNPVVNFVFDKSGEGMEEVITGVLDPWIARLTYNKEEDLATFETMFDDYIGGVLMSLLVGAPQAAVNTTRNAANLVIRGAENSQSAGWTGNTFNAYTQRFMQNPDWAEKSRGSAEIAERAEASDSESLRRYADIYNRMDDVLAMLDGKEPASAGETAFVNAMEAQNYFYIWDTQGAKAADAYYEQNVYAAARNRQAQAEATYQQQQAEKQAREAARQQAEQEALARQAKAEKTLAQQGPPLPQAAQNTPESVTTPPLPGNAQRAAEGPGEGIVASPAEARNDGGLRIPAAKESESITNPTESRDRRTGALRIPGSRAESNATVKALQSVNPELLEAYMTEGMEGDTTIGDAVNAVNAEVQKGAISARAGAEFLDMMWQAGSDAAARKVYLGSIYDADTGDLRPQALNAVQRIDARNRNGGLTIGQAENPAAAVGQQERTGQAEAAPAAEAAEAGNNLADGGRGRVPGQRAGEQDGRLAEAKRAVSQYNKASGRRADAKNLRVEEVDARERIREAAKGSRITVAPEQMVQQDKELRTVAQRLEEITGKKVYYILGNIQRQGADGSISQARGAITADGIYLRCDHNDLSVTQLAAHELYHYYERLYPGLSARMKEKIIQTYTEEKFNKVAKVYVEKLGAINGLTDNQDAEAREAALARIESEIFADAFGSINYGGAKADKFNALVRQTLNETTGSETAAATERRTGPPDALFSADEEEEIPQSAAEYARMKERNKAREAELRRLVKKGEATEEQKREAAELRKKLKVPKAAVKKQQATIAKKQLRNTIISEFGIPDGRKAEIGKLIDAYADRLLKEKEISWSDRLAFFRKLYDEGVMTVPANDMYQAAREIVRGGKVYVPENVKHEFGDDWNDFRRQAFAEGIYLTNNPADKSADSWNVELSSEFPGMFPGDNYDQRDILERIVSAAQAGRDEQMSLAEYAAKVVGQEYVSEDEAMDNMERRLDWALRSFADKAGLETWLKDKAEEKLAKQREQFGERLDAIRAQEIARQAKERDKRKEAARKQTLNRELREMQQRTLKQLQWLSKNRQKFSGNMQDKLNEILSDIDVYAVSAADEAHLDKASNKTWRELADIYKDARENDPNFLPSKDLERIVERLDNRKIGDMDIDAVTELYKAAVGLRTELYNRNNVIGSELHETFQEVYDQVKDEMPKAKGGYKTGAKGTAQKFFSDLQLTPMNVMERMAGWNKDSAWYKMAKQLEAGERAQRKFKTDSARMLAPFLEAHKDWVKKADGQGKDAIWYEVEVPELLELGMGDKPIFGNTVKVYMTPAQKVHMYLESQNYDNLRHMTGGRTFADRELYSKGKRAEAFAQGKTIRLAPETVKNLVKDLTAEEKALANALRPFYNDFSKKEINRVSNLLLGYNKAMEGDYAPIYTNKNYTQSEPGIFDTTAEGVGNLKSRVVSSNPSLNISALDAFEKSVDRTSRYVGLAVPVRNMNTLMNWREKGNSMADVLTHKWGQWALAYINGGSWEGENGKKHNEIGLLNELQGGRPDSGSSIEALTDAALSKYISAVFGANPSIVLKQFASYPLAAAYLGWENMPVNIPRAAQVDTDLIAKYTGEYDYRQLGYAMPETATLKDNPGKLQEKGPLNFIFGGGAITWMDGFTVRTLWSWAENKVNKEQPGLERGSQAQIDAGNSEYYKAVAAEFEEALSRSQPMYDTMHRANIMRESNPITRAFTLFKTVPMQEYNMLRQAIGEAQYAKENNLDKETQTAARQKAGRAFASVLAGNLMIGAITVLNALWKNRGKKYRDEDGNISAEKLIAEAGKQYFKDAAGLVIGGGEAADVLSSILFGDKWYGLETPGMEQIESIMEQTVKAGLTVGKLVQDSIEVLRNGGNWAQYMADHSDIYLSAVDSVARTLGTYATGLPIDNVKAYLLGAVQWLSPEVKTAYEDILDKADRSGLKGLHGASLEIRTRHILQERAGSTENDTVEALAGLYEAGYKEAIPAAQQTEVTVDGEERQLNLAQQQTYKKAWQETVGGNLDELVSSQAFQDADEKTQAKMLKKLYELATDRAKSALFGDVEDNTWDKAQDMLDAGLSLEDYVSAYAWNNAIKNDEELSSYERGKQQREMISGMDYSDEAKLALYESLNPSATSRIEKFQEIMDTGMGFDDVLKVYDKYAAIDERGDLKAGEKAKEFALWVDSQKYSAKQKAAVKEQFKYGMYMSMDTERYDKLTGKGLDPTTAYNVDQAISSLTPKPGKESVSDTQKWQAAMKNTSGEANQKKALEALMTEEQYAKFLKTGVSASAYVNYRVAVSDLSPLPGHDGVTNAQKWNAALKSLGSSASKKDKLALVGDIVGTDMTTKSGEPTLWAKINRVVDSGKSVEDTMKLAEEEKLDVYVKWMDSDAKAAGIKSDTYIAWRETYANTNSTRDENGKEVKGQKKKDKILAYIDGLNLTREQKDALFLEEYKESGLSDTPWHSGGGKGSGSYAMARTPALRIPEAPRAEKPSSGLRISTSEPTQRQSSGLRIRSTQPGEARQGSGLRIRDAAPAAQAPRSGLRIRAK